MQFNKISPFGLTRDHYLVIKFLWKEFRATLNQIKLNWIITYTNIQQQSSQQHGWRWKCTKNSFAYMFVCNKIKQFFEDMKTHNLHLRSFFKLNILLESELLYTIIIIILRPTKVHKVVRLWQNPTHIHKDSILCYPLFTLTAYKTLITNK